MLHGGLKSFAFQQLDQRCRHKRRDNGDALARLECVDTGTDERKRFVPPGKIRANIKGFEFWGSHLKYPRLSGEMNERGGGLVEAALETDALVDDFALGIEDRDNVRMRK